MQLGQECELMGGWGSGRQGGRPIAEDALFVELQWMLRTGRAKPGKLISGELSWTRGGHRSGCIGYTCNMIDEASASLTLRYTRTAGGGKPEKVEQHIWLTTTRPNYGGQRWWMICPYGGGRAAKLFLPGNGDRFASRKAWRLGYRSQREPKRDRPFSELFKLQRRLGCYEGWEQPIRRPKGMWQRTFEKHEQRYWELDEKCSYEMMTMMGKLRAIKTSIGEKTRQ